MAKAVFDNLLADKPRDRFTVGITGASADGRGVEGGGVTVALDQVTVCWMRWLVGVLQDLRRWHFAAVCSGPAVTAARAWRPVDRMLTSCMVWLLNCR